MRKEKALAVGSEEAFEMIELATSDLETLARAFELISEVCADKGDVEMAVATEPEYLIN